MNAVVTVGAGQSLWVSCSKITVRERTVITLTRSVDGIVVKTQLPECQLHGTLQARWGKLVYAISHDVINQHDSNRPSNA